MQVKTTWLSEISVADSKPGDLIYFAENRKINHVAFSLGEGKIIHCSGEVKIESINADGKKTLAKKDVQPKTQKLETKKTNETKTTKTVVKKKKAVKKTVKEK